MTNMPVGILLGAIQICMSIGYLVISIRQAISAASHPHNRGLDLRLLRAVFGPIILFITGSILITQGWRQDFILLSKDVLMSVLIGYLIILDLRKSYRSMG